MPGLRLRQCDQTNCPIQPFDLFLCQTATVMILMRNLYRSFALALLLLAAPPALAAGQFVTGVDDLPLMTGLTLVESGHVEFDSPGGRIVTTYAKGAADRTQVAAFYAQTLPQLGWKPIGDSLYLRETETLRIDYDETQQPGLTVRFSLSPFTDEKRGG